MGGDLDRADRMPPAAHVQEGRLYDADAHGPATLLQVGVGTFSPPIGAEPVPTFEQ
jgi:hypothetical protein